MHLVWVLRQKQKQIHIWSLYFSAKWDFINGAFSFASTQNKWPKGGGKFFFKSDEQPFTPRWCWKRRRTLLPFPNPKPKWRSQEENQEGSAERYPQPQNEDAHITHLLVAQDAVALEAAQMSSKKERTQEKQAWPLCHLQNPPAHWVSHEEDRRQRHTCAHCGCQGQQAPGHTGCEETLTLMWPKSTPS